MNVVRAVAQHVIAPVHAVQAWRQQRRAGRGLWYVDPVVRVDEHGLTIRGYYWPHGRKRIPFQRIQGHRTHALTMGHGQYRVHGIDRRGRWYSRDRTRQDKPLAIVLDIGRRIRPVLTPTDPQAVLAILETQRGRHTP